MAEPTPDPSIPSVFVTKFYVSVGAVFTQIWFGNQINGVAVYHSSITLPTPEAVLLAELMTKLKVQSDEQHKAPPGVKPS